MIFNRIGRELGVAIEQWQQQFAVDQRRHRHQPPVLAVAEVDATNASPGPQTSTAAEAAVSPDQAQSLEAMARDLASGNQEIAQLKASVEQLKASQQQFVAMASEKAATQNLRPRKPTRS